MRVWVSWVKAGLCKDRNEGVSVTCTPPLHAPSIWW